MHTGSGQRKVKIQCQSSCCSKPLLIRSVTTHDHAQVSRLDLSHTQLSGPQLCCLLTAAIWSNSLDHLHLTGAQLHNTADLPADLSADNLPADDLPADDLPVEAWSQAVSPQLLLDSVSCLASLGLAAASLSRPQLIAVLQVRLLSN